MEVDTVTVSVKWGKEKYDIGVHINEPAIVFKQQIFSLTLVSPERQKVFFKGKLLKDADSMKDTKPGQLFTMMGTVDTSAALEKPISAEKAVFLEDLPEDEQSSQFYPPGLANLGNTCYMNSCIQCLKSIPELSLALKSFALPHVSVQQDPDAALTLSMRELFQTIDASKKTVSPFLFVTYLRQAFPQFDQVREGIHVQQDAEECWTLLNVTLNSKVKIGSNPAISKLFGGEIKSITKCLESSEEPLRNTTEPFVKLTCHISNSTSFLIQGLRESFSEQISINSTVLGREAMFQKDSQISKLPPYLCIQFVRFFWKQDAKVKAKIIKPVDFPLTLDVSTLCTEELQQKIKPTREKIQQEEENQKSKKQKSQEETQKLSTAEPSLENVKENDSGLYDLIAVLTHKGRTADSGHYISWVKHSNDLWIKFDDDKVSSANDEDIKKLKGGGDWHIAYLCIYASKKHSHTN